MSLRLFLFVLAVSAIFLLHVTKASPVPDGDISTSVKDHHEWERTLENIQKGFEEIFNSEKMKELYKNGTEIIKNASHAAINEAKKLIPDDK